jgi:hypothetical protein
MTEKYPLIENGRDYTLAQLLRAGCKEQGEQNDTTFLFTRTTDKCREQYWGHYRGGRNKVYEICAARLSPLGGDEY